VKYEGDRRSPKELIAIENARLCSETQRRTDDMIAAGYFDQLSNPVLASVCCGQETIEIFCTNGRQTNGR
jgi:hypothetical protein